MSMYHDVMEALTPLLDAFDQLGIAYYIGGSVPARSTVWLDAPRMWT